MAVIGAERGHEGVTPLVVHAVEDLADEVYFALIRAVGETARVGVRDWSEGVDCSGGDAVGTAADDQIREIVEAMR